MLPILFALIWVGGSILVGLLSKSRKFGFWGGFFFSLLLSPIVMILILMMTKPARKDA